MPCRQEPQDETFIFSELDGIAREHVLDPLGFAMQRHSLSGCNDVPSEDRAKAGDKADAIELGPEEVSSDTNLVELAEHPIVEGRGEHDKCAARRVDLADSSEHRERGPIIDRRRSHNNIRVMQCRKLLRFYNTRWLVQQYRLWHRPQRAVNV